MEELVAQKPLDDNAVSHPASALPPAKPGWKRRPLHQHCPRQASGAAAPKAGAAFCHQAGAVKDVGGNSSSSAVGAPAADETVFKVLYTKRAPKKQRKNKSFMDGLLVVPASGPCRLLDDQGSVIARKSNWNAAARCLEPGSEAEVGPWEIEIDEKVRQGAAGGGPGAAAGGGPARAVRDPSVASEAAAAAVERPSGGCAPPPDAAAAAAAPRANKPKAPRRAALQHHSHHGAPQAPEAQLVLNEAELMRQWEGPGDAAAAALEAVTVDRFLAQLLRPHQQEGVRFLYECVMGVRQEGMHGCILADEMGLGKTLQVITLLWTLLHRGPDGHPAVRKACVVAPSSLVHNWAAEFKKWLGNARLKPLVVAPGPESIQLARDFKLGQSIHRVMITSYETLRKVAPELSSGCCDIVVCDEGHRLKAAGGSKTIEALESLNCSRRILLTGTPIQNSLDEFYAMMSFVNPDLLGPLAAFKRVYSAPIQQSRDRGASKEEEALGKERSSELAELVAPFVLRRSSDILAKHLPPLTKYVVFVRPTTTQVALYNETLSSGAVSDALSRGEAGPDVLSAITRLRKICNHPDLVALRRGVPSSADEVLAVASRGSPGRQDEVAAPSSAARPSRAQGSGKMAVLRSLLVSVCHREGNRSERMVVVCSSTQALDVIGEVCGELGLSTVRIDGQTDANRRQEVVDGFNKHGVGQVCLLSTRAGGAGLNLIGASRLVLYDSEWNPAVDQQAMARIHRDGQKRPCVIYRLLTAGTIDEKIYQRQLRKGELAEAMRGGGGGGGSTAMKQQQQQTPKFTMQELQQIFTLDTETACETAEILRSAAESSSDSVAVRGGRGPDAAPDEGNDDGGRCWANEMGSLDDAALLAAIDSTRAVTFVRMVRGRQQQQQQQQQQAGQTYPCDGHEGIAAAAKDTTVQEMSRSGGIGNSSPAKERRESPEEESEGTIVGTYSRKRSFFDVVLSSDDDDDGDDNNPGNNSEGSSMGHGGSDPQQQSPPDAALDPPDDVAMGTTCPSQGLDAVGASAPAMGAAATSSSDGIDDLELFDGDDGLL